MAGRILALSLCFLLLLADSPAAVNSEVCSTDVPANYSVAAMFDDMTQKLVQMRYFGVQAS